MQTIDLNIKSELTGSANDCEKTLAKIRAIYGDVGAVIYSTYLHIRFQTVQPGFWKDVGSIALEYRLFFSGRFEIKVDCVRPVKADINTMIQVGQLIEFPTTISEIGIRDTSEPERPRVRKAYRIVKEHFPELDAFHKQLIGVFRAQSKEDFYDDASDYQDDEPTDFGDAANYDENLVRRIRKVIE